MGSYDRLVSLVEERALSRSLPTALTVATSIGDDGLASWIRRELVGYVAENPAMAEDVVVPEYRAVVGNWYDDYGRLFLIPGPELSFVNEIRLRQGVAELEGYATATGVLSMRQLGSAAIIRENLQVDVTVFQFQAASVSQVLTNIKVHLLEELAGRQEGIAAVRVAEPGPQGEILQLKPQFYGVGVDLRVLWRRLFGPKG